MEMSQLYIGPFLCCYGISLCNRYYDYESILDKLLILTNKMSESSLNRHQIIQSLVEKFFNVEVSWVIVYKLYYYNVMVSKLSWPDWG